MTEEAFRAAFGAALDRQLKARGVTRYGLAGRLGVSTQYVSMVANGRRAASPAFADRVSTVLSLTPEESVVLHKGAALSRGYRIAAEAPESAEDALPATTVAET